MWNVGQLDQAYNGSVTQHLHMTSSECKPSTIAQEAPFYTTRPLPASSHASTQGYYTATLPVGGTIETLSSIQNQPRSFYRANQNKIYSTNDYSSTEGNQRSSSNASFVTSRAGSYDSSFPHAVTPESGISSQVDVYSYMYSHGQEPTGLIPTPPTLSPTAGPQHQSKKPKTSSRQRKARHQNQCFSPESMAASTPGNRSKLRSASRTSKNTHHNPPASAEERKSRETHNNVEKQYRNRLNAHFESLLSALPESMQCGEGEEGGDCGLDSTDRRVSKAEVLDMARRHIKALERACTVLETERDELRENMEKLRWLFGRCEGGTGEGPAFTASNALS
ncbi:hypothetical protein GGR57DRAFT_19067 [Xylariaceae sp. FL1272]|nr:hypothetical protein GGR57DRAFT_19067 [Xylariaceae sp. FL1272]